MVHTRHSFQKDTLEDFSNLNGHHEDESKSQAMVQENIKKKDHHTSEGDDQEKKQSNDVDKQEPKENKDEDETKDENDRKPRKRRRTMLDLYDSLSYHDTFQRRSLRKISREQKARFMGHYDGSSRRKVPRSQYDELGSSRIRRSDRQKKKVFDTFNESEIQREIERKHKEMMEAASMYDAIKRRREEHSETQDDEEGSEEETDEEEEEEDEGVEDEGHKAYSLRKTRQKTNLYQAPLPSHRERRREVLFNMQSPLHKSRRQRIPQHSPHHRNYKRRRRTSSTSSSDDEAAFERRKSKSMSQARSRCLPMNFQANDIVGVLKNRERAREGGMTGSSLADIEPMTIDSNTTFDDVGGLDHHIRSLKEMVVFPLLYPEVFQKFGISPPRGVLFYGPPGTGKTLVARALANECSQKGQKVAFFMRKGADCLSKWVGESERQLRLLFDQAYTMRPSIIFFDEIDGIAPVRSTRQDQIHSSIVSTLLALMDGLDTRGEIVVIGATNRLDSIDPALRRPGRFDREFRFNLPNRKARQKIIELHTTSWQPKLSKEFMLELADKCVGYCGADLKALCTEATLFALRRRYPQIYKSSKKYVLDMNEIKISVVDFKNALKSVTPASNRSGVAPGRALPESLKPLLSKYVKMALEILMKVFPAGKKITDYDHQGALESSDDEDMNIYEKPRSRSRTTNPSSYVFKIKQNVIEECLTHRPRILLHGRSGNGQTTYVAPSILYAMEHLTTHVMDLPVLFGSSTRTAEEAVSQVFREAKRTSPSIVYLPHIMTWWNSVSETTRATFMTLLQDIQPTVPVLFVATSEVSFNDIPESIQDLFSTSRGELFEVEFPTSSQRHSYFKDLFMDHALRVPAVVQRKGSKRHFVEILQEASPAKPRELSQEECKKLIESEETTLRELRLFLRNITWKLLADRKYKEFSKPVDSEEVDDYLQVIKEPMDLSTVMTRINAHHYHSCAHFLKDIDLITNNCLEYNPDRDQCDKILRNRACELRDVAHALVHNDLDPEFEKLCIEVNERRQQRGDTTTFAPSFLKVLPSQIKKTGQNEILNETSSSCTPLANIPDPTGPRYSRRVRGISDGVMFDASVLALVESSRRRSMKPSDKPKDTETEEVEEEPVNNEDKQKASAPLSLAVELSVDESSQDTVMSVDTERESDHTESANNDEELCHSINSNVEPDATIDKVKRSLEFQGADPAQKDVSVKEEADRLLSKLVESTTGCTVQDLERIFSGLCRCISDRKNDQDRFVVLKELHKFAQSLQLESSST